MSSSPVAWVSVSSWVLPMLSFGGNIVICPFDLSLSESLAEFALNPSPWLLAPQSLSGRESPVTL